MKSNNEICLLIYNTINISGIIYKLGGKDFDETTQIIYEIILYYDNKKLNNILDNGALLSFVYIICRNQISNSRRKQTEQLDFDIIDEVEEEYDDKLKFIEDEFRTIQQSTINKMTNDEREYFVKKLLLMNKVKRSWTLTEMHKKMCISRNTLNDIIVSIKKELKFKYNEKNKS